MPERDDPCGPGRFFAPTRSINIRTALPGPKGQVVLDRLRAASGIMAGLPLVVAHAHGARVIDVDNNVFVDFASGLIGAEVGHTPEPVIERLTAQAELTHSLPTLTMSSDVEVTLCEALNEITPRIDGVKHTRLFVARPDLPATVFEPLLSDVPPIGATVADETLIGIGRTGRWFACEHSASLPDAILYGGTLGAGLPLYALTGNADVVDRVPSSGGINPLICATSLESIRLMRDHQLPARAAQLGSLLDERCTEWKDRSGGLLRDITGLAAWRTLHLPDAQTAALLQTTAFHNGLLLAAENASIPLRFPLMIPEEQFHEGLDVLDVALETVMNR